MVTNINFNKTRYIELLKKEEFLKNNGTFLFDENPEEDLELLSYSVILENQIYYNRRAVYISLIEEYLRENAGEDGAHLLVWEFSAVFKQDNKALDVLEKEIIHQGIQRLDTFHIDPKSTEFSEFVNGIVASCEFLTFNPEDTFGMNLNQFRDSIQEIYLNIQKNHQE